MENYVLFLITIWEKTIGRSYYADRHNILMY